MISTWIMLTACVLIFALMFLNALPRREIDVDDDLDAELAKIHIYDTPHPAVALDEPVLDPNLPGKTAGIWQWDPGRTIDESHRTQLAQRFVAEAPWERHSDGTWHVATLIGEHLTVSEDPRGTWRYASWPTETATKPPVDDNNATITARTIWGAMGENTHIDVSDENGYRVVRGEYLLEGCKTGLTMNAVLDGGLVVYADSWCITPTEIRRYEKPPVADVLAVWNRSARGGRTHAVSWKDAYTTAVTLDGEVYLMPAYEFTDRDANSHIVTAIDPAIIRVHPARQTESASA